MAVIGFIGTGVMGRPMAGHLVRAGHEVRCYGRSERSRARAAQAGATVCDSVGEACFGAEFLITVLPDSSDVHQVVLGTQGAFASLARGACHIDHSTISPDAALAVHAAARALGIDSLDAPVSGGEAGAIDGTLSIMVGGEAGAFDRARPVLESLGTTIVHVGPAGSGQVVKAANQMVVAGNLQMLAEAIVFLRAHGADVAAALDVLEGGLAGSTALTRKRRNFLEESYIPGFRVALHAKDFRIINEASLSLGLALPATGLVGSLFAAMQARGDGALDHSALLKLALELNGHPTRPTGDNA